VREKVNHATPRLPNPKDTPTLPQLLRAARFRPHPLIRRPKIALSTHLIGQKMGSFLALLFYDTQAGVQNNGFVLQFLLFGTLPPVRSRGSVENSPKNDAILHPMGSRPKRTKSEPVVSGL
jgi:hypothetical protein